jgi:hypothetical protein
MKKILLPLSFLAIGHLALAQPVMYVQSGVKINVQRDALLTLKGGIYLAPDVELIHHGTITVGDHSDGRSSDWVDHAGINYLHGDGTLIFNATGPQILESGNSVGKIVVNNGGLTVLGNVAADRWNLTKGVVHIPSDSTEIVIMDPGNDAIEAGPGNEDFSKSWFSGRICRVINSVTNNTYILPMGDSSRVYIAELDNLMADPISDVLFLRATFGPKQGDDVGLVVTEGGSVYTSIHDAGVWYFSPDIQPSSGKFNLKLHLNGFDGLQDNAFTILTRPELSSNAAHWVVPPGSSVNPNGGAGRMVADGYAQRNDLSQFGQFGIGLLSAALPVTLTRFDATRLNQLKVNLTWETSSEQYNRGFYIERRLDNETVFTEKDFVPSRATDGNSNHQLNYRYIDANGYGGISYYRLKQVDLDNRAHYSLIKAVHGLGESSVSVMIWPNPNQGQFSIKMDGINESKDALIMDMNGKVVRRLVLNGQQQVNINGLTVGTYILSIPNAFGQGSHFTEKIAVVR